VDLFESFPLFEPTADWESGNQILYDKGLTDGLPVALPTREKLEEMLEHISNKEKSYGKVPTGMREANPSNVAYHAAMAGCRPDEFPVVLTAVAASLDPVFNLMGIQTTTGTPTTAVMMHGPVVERLGANAAANCLGPGNRVNACIGRAVRLALTNLGMAYPGTIDMATMGQPGKYTFCFAEATKGFFVPPLHVRKGLSLDQSAITLLGVSGTVEIYDTSQQADATLETLVRSIQMPGNVSHACPIQHMGSGELFILMPPEIIDLLGASGWTLTRMQQYIFDHGAVHRTAFTQEVQKMIEGTSVPIAKSPRHIHPIVTGGIGIKMTFLQMWPGGTESVTISILS
jgi:hypothetical protein